MSTIDTSLDLIRCLQHWHLISLVKLTFNPYSWKWFGQQLITCQQLTQILAWLGVCNIGTWSALKAKSHWNFLWLAVSKYWLALTQFLLYRDCTAPVFRVCSESWFLGFDFDFLDVYHWGVGPTCQWTIIKWMTHQEISLLNLLRVIHLEWIVGGRALYIRPFV
jgi:hypothetical protein